ncbi:MAG: hypothetical protein H7Y31_00225, partial [Chitinophagaceae bacterium]|nr:hypothetical protein [Chitinophagaceae bacterium]
MKSKAPHYLLTPILVSAFFILHIVNEYFGLLPTHLIVKYSLYYGGLSICLLALAIYLFKKNEKAVFWSILALIIFFFFGSFHDFIKSTSLPAFFSSYTFLLPFFLLALIVGIVAIRKSSSTFITINKYLFLLFALITSYETVMLVVNSFRRDELRLVQNRQQQPVTELPTIADSARPDIFYIVFDEYPSSLSLKENCNFDNGSIDSSFKRNQFIIADSAVSNYNSTPLSIAA